MLVVFLEDSELSNQKISHGNGRIANLAKCLRLSLESRLCWKFDSQRCSYL